MATSAIHSTFTPAAAALLHTERPMLRYCRENSRVAKLRYAVKFECNVVRGYMNFKLNLGGPLSKRHSVRVSVLLIALHTVTYSWSTSVYLSTA